MQVSERAHTSHVLVVPLLALAQRMSSLSEVDRAALKRPRPPSTGDGKRRKVNAAGGMGLTLTATPPPPGAAADLTAGDGSQSSFGSSDTTWANGCPLAEDEMFGGTGLPTDEVLQELVDQLTPERAQ